jgi:Flp pilus assembly protein TadD
VLAACRPSLEADAKDAEVMVILSRAEIDRGRLGEARSLARKALVADPARADAYVFLGTAEQEAGKLEEARAAYKKYLELAPDGRFAREIRAILNNL